MLATDEDAEVKRAILQLIYVNDLKTLQSLLQISQKEDIGGNLADQYEFNLS